MTLEVVPVWPAKNPTETLTHDGAQSLARRIRTHWANMGWKVHVWVTREWQSDRDAYFGVRSDLSAARPKVRFRNKEQMIEHLRGLVPTVDPNEVPEFEKEKFCA